MREREKQQQYSGELTLSCGEAVGEGETREAGG
jgi:hypothetical protein